MHTVLTALVYPLAIMAFYTVILYFFHKASVHFHKMNEAVGKIETNEMFSNDSSFPISNINKTAILATDNLLEDSEKNSWRKTPGQLK